MSPDIHVISSMATRLVLAELADRFERHTGCRVTLQSVGGVLAAAQIEAGQACDAAILPSDAIDRLIAGGHLQAGSRVDLIRSGVAMATGTGRPAVDMSSEDAVREAVSAAPSIGYSTGPSGQALLGRFRTWGMAEQIQDRLVQAPPGTPVASLIARGEVAIGFQQLSELLHAKDIQLLGPLPPAIQITTVFSAGTGAASRQAGSVRALLDFMNSPDAAAVKRRHGMDTAST